APGVGRRVIHFRAGEIAAAAESPGDEDFAIAQQRRRVTITPRHHRRCRAPGVGRGVIEFRADASAALESPGDEAFAIAQQRRRVKIAWRRQRPGTAPRAAGPDRRERDQTEAAQYNER